MGNKRRKRARRLSSIAKEGAIRVGHQGLYGVVDRLRASAAKLDGAKRREVLFKCDQTRQALDAGMQAFAARLRDPSVSDHAAIYEGVYNLLEGCQPLYHAAMSSKGSFAEACGGGGRQGAEWIAARRDEEREAEVRLRPERRRRRRCARGCARGRRVSE